MSLRIKHCSTPLHRCDLPSSQKSLLPDRSNRVFWLCKVLKAVTFFHTYCLGKDPIEFCGFFQSFNRQMQRESSQWSSCPQRSALKSQSTKFHDWHSCDLKVSISDDANIFYMYKIFLTAKYFIYIS